MTANPPRKIAFVLAASDHGTMIVNRFDYHMYDENRGFGVGLDILNTAAFDRDGVEFAEGLLALRRRYFGDGVVAIDCGANIGVFTLEWARAMTGWGSVIAIEAQERIYYALAGNIAINNCFNARAILAAVADKPGVMKLPKIDYGRPASFGSVEIKKRQQTEFIGQPIDYSELGAIEIACITLDSLNLTRADLVKIDVEGMEFDVLCGRGQPPEAVRPGPDRRVRQVRQGQATWIAREPRLWRVRVRHELCRGPQGRQDHRPRQGQPMTHR